MLTLSGLLNMLDGVVSTEGRLVFMTTNYINRLDPALIRPGRVDLIQFVGNATDTQIIKLFKKFYPDEPDSSQKKFLADVRKHNRPVSMAALQGYFMIYKHTANEALNNVEELFNKK